MRKQSEWLKGLKIEAPQIAEETFAVFPLTTQSFNERGYLTLDEAIQQSLVFIPESGRVPESSSSSKAKSLSWSLKGQLLSEVYRTERSTSLCFWTLAKSTKSLSVALSKGDGTFAAQGITTNH